MKIVRGVIFFPLALTRLVFVLLCSAAIGIAGTLWLKLFGFSRGLQKNVLQVWGKCMMFICGIKVMHNPVPDEPHYLLMTNHRSYLDIVVLAAFLPASFVAKSEVLSWPLMKRAARLTNIIFVSRTELKSLISALNKIKASVGRGIPVAIFPEGTTARGPLTKPFKKGSFKIAADAGMPIIPAAIHFDEEDDAWIDEDTFIGHFFRQMGKPVTRVHLRFGQAVSGTDVHALRREVRQKIDVMLAEIINQSAK